MSATHPELARTSDIWRVGVVGCGLMGSGIAEVCAAAGFDVLVAVSRESSRVAGQKRIADSLERRVAKGRITAAERTETEKRIAFTTDLEQLADRQIVIESIVERETAKTDLLRSLDRILDDPEAILASNTSSLSITRLARATGRPGHVIGTHFFSPVPAMPLVEVVGALTTDDKVVERTERFVAALPGKQAIRAGDRAGFVVNALLIPYLLAAIRMVESGYARAEEVDRAMVLGCAHPHGPLKLADLVGLDTIARAADALYGEFKQPLYAPPPLLLRMVEGGLHGKKTGRGFYTY
jgi:3-hydroxybutyryl-CoA dehydrogenase